MAKVGSRPQILPKLGILDLAILKKKKMLGKQGSNDSHYSQIMILVLNKTDIGCCLTR